VGQVRERSLEKAPISGENRTWGMHAIWGFNTNSPITSTPAWDAAGRIFFGSMDSVFRALDAQGNELWAVPLPFQSVPAITSSPALSDDGEIVYVGSSGNALRALSASNGSVLWTFVATAPEDAHLQSSPVVASSGSVIFAGPDSFVHSLDGRTGAEIWHAPTILASSSSGVIGANDAFYICMFMGLAALNVSSGVLLWYTVLSSPTVTTFPSSPAVGKDGAVFTSTCSDVLFAVNGSSGSIKCEPSKFT
jgi:outer membrane protein assembly factor BamB